MRIIKKSQRERPKVSLILLDWGVRESFHLLHYLKIQTVTRDSFEVIVVEYYDYISPAIMKFESEVDTWVVLQMPGDCYYHKHLMYNVGVLLSRGEVLMFCDSDAMVRPTFIERVITSFDREPLIVYHMDEFRNVRRDFYPFNYPAFEEVLGEGCINNIGGKTRGVLDTTDPVHTRNYGACMCARRDDIISIGGADEDISYVGHICGPYDMTFRLMNRGRRLAWETDEYLYHTWHPGTDGIDNYLGPHDGMNMSTTAFQALCSGRLLPLVENSAIRELRTGTHANNVASSNLLEMAIDPQHKGAFKKAKLGGAAKKIVVSGRKGPPVFASYKGFNVYQIGDHFHAIPEEIGIPDFTSSETIVDDRSISGKSFSEIRAELDNYEARLIETVCDANICAVGERYAIVPCSIGPVDFRLRKQRNDPRILWAESLATARHRAARVGTIQPVVGETNDHEVCPTLSAHQFSLPQVVLLLTRESIKLNQRLSRVEAHISHFNRNRFFRALSRVRSIVNTVLGRGR